MPKINIRKIVANKYIELRRIDLYQETHVGFCQNMNK